MMKRLLVAAALVLASFTSAHAAEKAAAQNAALRAEILAMDARFFGIFNQHDADAVGRYLTADCEFFHDKGGLTNKAETIAALRKMFAANPKVRRELIADSQEVYPVPGYGAMQIGTHRFCNTEDGVESCSILKFATVWKKSGNGWQMARVLSYDH